MMDYQQSLSYIHGLNKFGKKAGLHNIRLLLEKMGNPQDSLRFVHIAGTNGKGSTTSMIASVLECHGLQVGKFISPYVLEFGERMQINGKMICHQELADITQYVKGFADELTAEGNGPVEFEVVTAIGFEFFKRKGCDIVVLEVGLGGLYDSTNIILPPLVSVITTIGLDHVAILGDTITKIAGEKSGIIKGPSPVVCYPNQHPEALAVIEQKAKEVASPFYMGDLSQLIVESTDLEGNRIIYKNLHLYIPLGGYHQVYNCINAVETLMILRDQYHYSITDEEICNGIARVRFPARMEVLRRTPTVILDGAHNESGIEALIQNLSQAPHCKINMIIGMLADKDFSSSLYTLCGLAAKLFTVTPPSPRSTTAEELANVLIQHNIHAIPCNTLKTAYEDALYATEKDDLLVICGSLYLASEMRPIVLDHDNGCSE